jgi:hypothetical protein
MTDYQAEWIPAGAASGGAQLVQTGPTLPDRILGAVFGDPDREAGQ